MLTSSITNINKSSEICNSNSLNNNKIYKSLKTMWKLNILISSKIDQESNPPWINTKLTSRLKSKRYPPKLKAWRHSCKTWYTSCLSLLNACVYPTVLRLKISKQGNIWVTVWDSVVLQMMVICSWKTVVSPNYLPRKGSLDHKREVSLLLREER